MIFLALLFRHLLSGLAGAATLAGYATGSQADAIVGGITAAAALAMSWKEKQDKK